MNTLNFTSKEGYFVSDSLTGGDNGTVVVHINFSIANNLVIVEHTIDENNGWVVASAERVPAVYEDTISGIADGQKVRIRTNYKPESASYLNA